MWRHVTNSVNDDALPTQLMTMLYQLRVNDDALPTQSQWRRSTNSESTTTLYQLRVNDDALPTQSQWRRFTNSESMTTLYQLRGNDDAVPTQRQWRRFTNSESMTTLQWRRFNNSVNDGALPTQLMTMLYQPCELFMYTNTFIVIVTDRQAYYYIDGILLWSCDPLLFITTLDLSQLTRLVLGRPKCLLYEPNSAHGCVWKLGGRWHWLSSACCVVGTLWPQAHC